MARDAIDRDATVVPAVVTVGLAAGLDNDEKGVEAWLAYSEKLSRRDLRTQLFLIEASVEGGDVAKALRHYDIALRTSETISSILFPVLRPAVSGAEVRRELVRTLVLKPQWGEAFIADLAENGPDYDAAVLLFEEARRNGIQISVSADAALLTNLTRRGKTSTAWRYYTAIHPGAASRLVRNATFDPDQDGGSPFDWQFTSGEGVTAALTGTSNDGMLEYSMAPTVGSQVARQMIFLTPGKYQLASVIASSSQSVGAGPYWTVQCVDGPSLGTLELGGATSGPRRFAMDFSIPANCPAQILFLTARPSDDVQGATGQIDSVSLKRLN